MSTIHSPAKYILLITIQRSIESLSYVIRRNDSLAFHSGRDVSRPCALNRVTANMHNKRTSRLQVAVRATNRISDFFFFYAFESLESLAFFRRKQSDRVASEIVYLPDTLCPR